MTDDEKKFRRIGVFTYCINTLDLTDRERMLMRHILMNINSDTLQLWGAMNATLEPEIAALFEKCKAHVNAEAA